MPIVWPCSLDVDAYVERGREIEPPRPPCPHCSGPTGGWSGYERHLRDERDRLIWIPRVRCGACGVTQALLPWFVVAWRWDLVEVIGAALEMAAEGCGHRGIAKAIGRPETTVRAWCRRFRGSAALVAGVLLARCELGLVGLGAAELAAAALPGGGRGDGCPVAASTRPCAVLAAGEPDHRRARGAGPRG